MIVLIETIATVVLILLGAYGLFLDFHYSNRTSSQQQIVRIIYVAVLVTLVVLYGITLYNAQDQT